MSWPTPNLTLLNAALRQTDWAGPELSARTWRETVAARIDVLDWDRAVADVRPFLEHTEDVESLTRENAARLLCGEPKRPNLPTHPNDPYNGPTAHDDEGSHA